MYGLRTFSGIRHWSCSPGHGDDDKQSHCKTAGQLLGLEMTHKAYSRPDTCPHVSDVGVGGMVQEACL